MCVCVLFLKQPLIIDLYFLLGVLSRLFGLLIDFKDVIIFDTIGMLAIFKKILVVQLGTPCFSFWGEKYQMRKTVVI